MTLASRMRIHPVRFIPFAATFQASGGGATIGSGTITTSYAWLDDVVIYQGSVTFAGDTNFGAGQLAFTLPVPVDPNVAPGPGKGPGYYADTGVIAIQGFADVVQAANQVRFWAFHTAPTGDTTRIGAARVTGTYPFSWGNGDVLGWEIVYPADLS